MVLGTETGTGRRNQAAQDTTQQERVARIKEEIEADWLSKVGYTSAPQKAVRTIDVDSWSQAPKIIAELAKNGRENIRLQFPDRSSNPAVRTDQQAIRQFFIDNHNASLDEMFKKLAEKMVSSSTLKITQETAQGLINAYRPSNRLTSKSLSVTKMCELGNKTENEFTQPILAAAEDTKDSTKPKTVFTITGKHSEDKLKEIAQRLQDVADKNPNSSETIMKSTVWCIRKAGWVLEGRKREYDCKELSIRQFIAEFRDKGDSNSPANEPSNTSDNTEPNPTKSTDKPAGPEMVTGDAADTTNPLESLVLEGPENNNDDGQGMEQSEQDNSGSPTSADIQFAGIDPSDPTESAEVPQTENKDFSSWDQFLDPLKGEETLEPLSQQTATRPMDPERDSNVDVVCLHEATTHDRPKTDTDPELPSDVQIVKVEPGNSDSSHEIGESSSQLDTRQSPPPPTLSDQSNDTELNLDFSDSVLPHQEIADPSVQQDASEDEEIPIYSDDADFDFTSSGPSNTGQDDTQTETATSELGNEAYDALPADLQRDSEERVTVRDTSSPPQQKNRRWFSRFTDLFGNAIKSESTSR